MATKADFIEYVREQLVGAGAMSYRKMFGEYAVYLDGKVVARDSVHVPRLPGSTICLAVRAEWCCV